jgi:hypothetical protein
VALYSDYTKNIYSELGYRGTWLPGTSVTLGDVGIIRKGVLQPETSLKQLQIDFQVHGDAVPDGSFDYQSKKAVNILFKAAGDLNRQFKALAQADAGALVTFFQENAVLMQLRGVRVDRIADKKALKNSLLDAVVAADDQSRWDRDWIVVTDVVTAESATILIAGGSSSSLELKASANIAPASLADANAGLSSAAESQVSTKIIAEKGLTPLYRGFRVRRNFWWLYDEVVTATGEVPDAEELFGDAEPESDPEMDDQ